MISELLHLPTALPEWQTLALVGALCALAILAVALHRVRARNNRLSAALDNMSTALCMFDSSTRIVVVNQRYIDMYKLSPKVVRPGCTLLELLRHRKETGLLTGDPEKYCRNIMDGVASGQDVDLARRHRRRPLHPCGKPADARRRLGHDSRGRHRTASA